MRHPWSCVAAAGLDQDLKGNKGLKANLNSNIFQLTISVHKQVHAWSMKRIVNLLRWQIGILIVLRLVVVLERLLKLRLNPRLIKISLVSMVG